MDGPSLAAAGHGAPHDPEILGITADSRAVRPGYLFVALPGSHADGRRFVDDAVQRGAAAVLTDTETAPEIAGRLSIPVFADANPRRRLAQAAARFYGPQPDIVVAVTGTNGKTSTASFTRQIWQGVGYPAASIGTLGIERPEGLEPGSMTTPDAPALHAALAALKRDGIENVAMEASSHGLDQHRLDGVRLTAAAFTNLTQDHLDYHGDMGSYRAAKLRLFSEVLATGGTAVLNADSPEFDTFRGAVQGRGRTVLDYGKNARALRLVSRKVHPTGQTLRVAWRGHSYEIGLDLLGEAQAMNALAALGLALATDIPIQAAIRSLEEVKTVRGRFEHIVSRNDGAKVFVDYAHTPDGLEKVLTAFRPHTAGRLVCVFGAGGDRDPTKRPKMGAAVAALADIAIVTDDNPRSEDPAAIRRAIIEACPSAIEIGDRAAAIEAAMRMLGPGDILVIAGKGHEQGQTVGATVLPFDDATVVREVARRLREAT
ncbi:MAG TPA: UDP-N-acetylmuramoyl-L-alanyl-D-glutamate--2,6-diaminopimelate ligase [Stellaceae bacterium]|nr:UDP-N-acetylmuramoyl-L-alanyl-D-glutamate--2,6-diaminopimelate ligase [Stellaceae bacterium]